MLALRGIAPLGDRDVTVAAAAEGLRFAARGGDGVLRVTTVTADPAPDEVRGDGCVSHSPSNRASARDVVLTFALSEDHGRPRSRPRRSRELAGPTRVHADDELFNRVLERSLIDLQMLQSSLDGEMYYAAGIR